MFYTTLELTSVAVDATAGIDENQDGDGRGEANQHSHIVSDLS